MIPNLTSGVAEPLPAFFRCCWCRHWFHLRNDDPPRLRFVGVSVVCGAEAFDLPLPPHFACCPSCAVARAADLACLEAGGRAH